MVIRMLEVSDESQIIALMAKDLTTKHVNFKAADCINDPNVHSLVVEDDSISAIVGHGALVVTRVPSVGNVGIVHDIVVADNYRGRGLGRLIVSRLLDIAKGLGLKHVNLTSNPSRIPARKLYESLGFVLVNTGVFRLQI